MCKGDGGRVLSNVELILPWNVVEACYTLERNDSTCFFAANDAEGTTSQISLCKLEDHSVKIQVTVTALEADEEDYDEEAGTGPTKGSGKEDSPTKRHPPYTSDQEESPRPSQSGKTPVRHRKKTQPDLALATDEYPADMEQEAEGIIEESPSQGKKKKRAKNLAEVMETRKRNQGFSLKQARSVLGQPQGKGGQSDEASETESPRRRSQRHQVQEDMPVLEVAPEDQEEVIDLETIYKYGDKMREFEARKKKEQNWDKVQEELKQGKDTMSMVIVLKQEGGAAAGSQAPAETAPSAPATKEKEKEKEDTPLIHVIEPMMSEELNGPEHWEYPDREEQVEEGPSTKVIYIHRHSKNSQDDLKDEDRDERKKFFKRRRDKGTRVAKKDNSKSSKPLWQQQVANKKGLKVEVEKPSGPISCRYCPRNFKDHSYLFRHVKGHHMDNTEAEEYLEEIRPLMKVSCPVCDKSISSMANVANHMRQCHPETDTAVKCETCDKVYKTPASLRQHMRQRHSVVVKRFDCPQCDMVFNERRGLTDHINCVHETTQVYTCNKCWKVFLTKSRLRRHAYIHGEHRYICKHCGKGFHIKDNMNKHIRIVHEKNHGKMWKCSYCNKEFLVKGNLTQHIRGIHLKQFPFTCSKCLQGFRRMRDMMLHMEKCNEEGQEGDVSVEMFSDKVKEEPTKTPRGGRKKRGSDAAKTPKSSTKKSKKRVEPESEEEEEEEEYVIQDEMVVSADEEEDEDEGDDGEVEEDEEEDEMETSQEEVQEDGEIETETVVEQQTEETQEVIINSNVSHDPNDPMKLHIEQDGVVIPIEVVIGQNEGGANDSFEVIAGGT